MADEDGYFVAVDFVGHVHAEHEVAALIGEGEEDGQVLMVFVVGPAGDFVLYGLGEDVALDEFEFDIEEVAVGAVELEEFGADWVLWFGVGGGEVAVEVGLHFEEVSVADDEFVFFLVGVDVDEGDACAAAAVPLVGGAGVVHEVGEVEHLCGFHGKGYGEVGGADEDEVYVFGVVSADAIAIDGGVGGCLFAIVEVAVLASDEDLFGPAGMGVVGDELDAERADFLEDVGGLEGGVGVEILEHAGDAGGTLLYVWLVEVAADAIDAFHIDGVVGGFLEVAHDVDLFGGFEMDVGVGVGGDAVAVVDDDVFELVLTERLTQFLSDFFGVHGTENENVSILILIKYMSDERGQGVVVSHDDVVAREEVVDASLLVVFHSALDGCGDESDDDAVEDEGSEQEGEGAGEEHPSVHSVVDVEIVECIGVDEQIEGQKPGGQVVFAAERSPVAAGECQQQVGECQHDEEYDSEHGELLEEILRQDSVEPEPESSLCFLFHDVDADMGKYFFMSRFGQMSLWVFRL